MLRLLALVATLAIVYHAFSWVTAFRKNLRKARASGIRYIIVPVFFLHPIWLMLHRLFLPFLAKLPRSWTGWVDFALPDFPYANRYSLFKQLGTDTFLTVSPGGLVMYTCDPSAISQITTRRNDFPKPTSIYRSLDIYGKNVVSSEGNKWRLHRKAISPPFTERNNHLVWQETIDQTQSMLGSWLGPDKRGDRTIDRVADDTMRLSLHVISRAGFGRKLQWPENEADIRVDHSYADPSKIQNEKEAADEGHLMSYTYAIHCLLDNIIFQFLFPRWLLQKAPVKRLKKANEAYQEWGNYMQEAAQKKRTELEVGKGSKDESMDILGQLVKSQALTKSDQSSQLSESEIMGNMFVLILAGHETAANSIHFSMVYLALHASSQRLLQRDLDQIFQGKPPSEWDYDRDLPQLFGSMVGAVLNEELRLAPPVVGIPKSTWGVDDQQLTLDGKSHTVPADTYISLDTIGVHRNPKYWPSGPPTAPGGKPVHPLSNVDNDLEDFRPERWLVSDDVSSSNKQSGATHTTDGIPIESSGGGDLNINESSDTSERLFKPVKGSYIPFSDGYRSCIGRRFAQVEVLAALAVIFQQYSVELAVDKYASDDEVINMSMDDRAETWQKAAEDARELLLNGMGVVISLQMRKGHVPVRLIPRGDEKFADDIDGIWKRNNPAACRNEGREEWRSWDNSKGYHMTAVRGS